MTKHFIAAVAFASFLAMPAMAVSDPPAWMMGLGAGPGGCGTWATAATGSLTDTAYSDWVMGYVSGANWWGKGIANNAMTFPNDSVILWVKNYCRGHPLESVAIGAWALVFELSKAPRQH
jgi:hypothetical protein